MTAKDKQTSDIKVMTISMISYDYMNYLIIRTTNGLTDD